MRAIKRNPLEVRELKQIEQSFLDAGYESIVYPNRFSSKTADFIAYASGPNGATLATAVELKKGDNLNFAVEALNLDLIRTRTGSEKAILITDSGIFELNQNGNQLEEITRIPPVTPSHEPITDQETILQLFWQMADESRGKESLESLLLQILEMNDGRNGVVRLPNSPIGIQGFAFRKMIGTLFASKGASSAEHFASNEVQFVFQSLARLFPDATSIFDPFFGLGLSVFSIADDLDERSKIASISGIEQNPVIRHLAQSLARSTTKGIESDLHAASAVEFEWPECDLLVSEPPLGVRLDQARRVDTVNCGHLETFAILRSAQMVREGTIREGAILLTGRGWLTRHSSQSLRDKLIEMDVVHAVLGIPSLKSNTSIPLAALILSRKPKDTVIGELLEDWREQLSGEKGTLHDFL